MQATKKKIGIMTVIAALLLTAIITCLQMSGVWSVKAAERGETVSAPVNATYNTPVILANSNDYQEYSKTYESGTTHIRNSLNFRTWYSKRPSDLKEWSYTLKLNFECKQTTCTTSGKEFGFTYGFVYQEDEYIDEGDGEYSTYSFDANTLAVKNVVGGKLQLRSKCDSKATTKFTEYTSEQRKHQRFTSRNWLLNTLKKGKLSI